MNTTSMPHRLEATAWPRGPAAWLARVAVVAFVLASLGAPEARASSADARRALDAVSTSIGQVRAGNYAGARTSLEGVEAIVKAQGTAITAFEGQASGAFQGCVAAVGELDKKIGEIAGTQERVKQDLEGTERALTSAVRDGQISADEVRNIQQRMAEVNASVRARQEKLRELERWWWVPGYGLYLGIRTLADNDMGELQSLARTLGEQRVQQQRSEQALRTAQNTAARLSRERSRLQAEHAAATGMRASLDTRMASVRQVTAFASDAKKFWADMDTFIGYQVRGAVDSTKVMADALGETLGKPGSDVLILGIGGEQTNLRDKLVKLAAELDRGAGYTALSRTACAPGPGSQQAKACNITVAWPHYEIVDPLTCSFRYVNPPGCPPAISTAKPGASQPNDAAQRARDAWAKTSALNVTAASQNWIGLSRCTSSEALYLGRVANEATCAAACANHAECQFWTYNRNNGMIDQSWTECWGGTRNLVPHVGPWGGFISGGVPCVPGQALSAQGLCK